MQRTIQDRPQLLVTILDWGMGHATRTLPLIEHAVESGWHVHVASKGTALAWLRSHLPQKHVSFHTKPGPEIKYADAGISCASFSRFRRLSSTSTANEPGPRTSCRPMALRPSCPTTATGAATPTCRRRSSLTSSSSRRPNGWKAPRAPWSNVGPGRLTRFGFLTWRPVPSSLSGALAEASIHPRTHCIGVLSRLAKHRNPKPERTWRKVGMVSGVEPHRQLMEQALRAWMQEETEPCLIVAGQPGGGVRVDGHITTWCDPTDSELASALQGAGTGGVPERLQLPTRPGGPRGERHPHPDAWTTRAGFLGAALGRSIWVHHPHPTTTRSRRLAGTSHRNLA